MSHYHTITICGWGQKPDGLANIAPDAHMLSYANSESLEAWLEALEPMECDTLIGWSQGGQLALKAISEGVIKAKKLVLISVPYQFVVSSGIKCGMNNQQFVSFKYAFMAEPERTIKRFSLMMSHNDSHQKEVFNGVQSDREQIEKWEYWLELLGEFTAQEIDFSNIPEKVLLVHGADDVVVESSQTSVFMPFMPHAQVEIWDKCAHAPHLHDATRLKQLIEAM